MPTLQQERLLLPIVRRGPAIIRTNLLAEFRFAGNTNDSGPHGYTATLGGVDPDIASHQPFGVRMDADAEFVSFPAASQIADKLDHTMQIVFRVPVYASDLVYIEGNSGSTEFVYINRGATGNLVVRYRRTTATSYDLTVNIAAVAPLNTWAMATLRRSGTALTVYGNNRALTGSATLGADALPARNFVRLNHPGGASSTAGPSRPDVAYLVKYTTALSDNDISANYTAIKGYLAARGVSLP